MSLLRARILAFPTIKPNVENNTHVLKIHLWINQMKQNKQCAIQHGLKQMEPTTLYQNMNLNKFISETPKLESEFQIDYKYFP